MRELFIFIFLCVSTNGVRLDIVRAACSINPSLSFCDSHLLGEEKAEIKKKKPPTVNVASAGTLGNTKEEKNDFVEWLNFRNKDEPDVDDEQLETSRRVHSDVDAYCEKYGNNYHQYCKGTRPEKLEGVLPQFCETFLNSCFDQVNNPVLEAKYPSKKMENGPKARKGNGRLESHSFPSAAVESVSETREDGQSEKRLFEGSKEDYCRQHAENFDRICRGGILKTQQDTIDFCTSFDTNCNSFSSSDSKETGKEEGQRKSVGKEETQRREMVQDKEGFTEQKEEGDSSLEDIDLGSLEELEKHKEKEEKKMGKSTKLSAYCEKYVENYNYFCAGEDESSSEHSDFCIPFRKNCPEKIGS